jgi:hypothetical protein
VVGGTAGIEQAQNHFIEYGQGVQGYAKRFGATYADTVSGTFIGGAILPSLLKQDPRYFYKGTGSTPSRFMYAIRMSVICKGDNGRWQFNYSNVLGQPGRRRYFQSLLSIPRSRQRRADLRKCRHRPGLQCRDQYSPGVRSPQADPPRQPPRGPNAIVDGLYAVAAGTLARFFPHLQPARGSGPLPPCRSKRQQ